MRPWLTPLRLCSRFINRINTNLERIQVHYWLSAAALLGVSLVEGSARRLPVESSDHLAPLHQQRQPCVGQVAHLLQRSGSAVCVQQWHGGAHAVHMRCTCGAHAVLMRCSCGAHEVLMRCSCGAHAVLMRCTCGAHAVLMRCTCGAHAVHMRCSCGVHMRVRGARAGCTVPAPSRPRECRCRT